MKRRRQKMNHKFVKNFIMGFKLCTITDRLYLPCVFLKSVCRSAFPFVGIIYSARILDGLINNSQASPLLQLVYQMVAIGGLLLVMQTVFSYICSYKSEIIYRKFYNIVSYKAMSLDYPQLESKELMESLHLALDYQQVKGGLPSFGENIEILFGNLVTFIYSCVLISRMFVPSKYTGDKIIVLILNNPLSSAITLLLICASIAYSLANTSKISRLMQTFIDKIVEGDRKGLYMYDICNDYQFGKDIRIFGMNDMLSEKLEAFTSETLKGLMSIVHNEGIIVSKSKFITQLAVFFSYGVIGLKALFGLLTVGSVTRLIGTITLFTTSVASFIGTLAETNILLEYMDKCQNFLDTPNEMYHGTLPIEKRDDNQYEIEFRNVSFHYPNSSEAILTNVSFKMDMGRKLAIVGPNGAGKTTFIKLLCRLYDPTEGEILLNGIDIKKYDYQEYSRLFSIVFQDFKLFSTTIRDNIAGSSPYEEDKIWNCLEKAGIKNRVRRMPDGINTYLYQNSEQGVEISGGEAQSLQ
jgi:ATP-binding cassette subfamily B protein